MNTQELKAALSQCQGTQQWYHHTINRNMTYTDGVKIFADNAGGGAHWFLDIVATELMAIHKTKEFLNIKLTVLPKTAVIAATDGNEKPLYHREIDFTDCPEGVWEFYLTNKVMLLPSEY